MQITGCLADLIKITCDIHLLASAMFQFGKYIQDKISTCMTYIIRVKIWWMKVNSIIIQLNYHNYSC